MIVHLPADRVNQDQSLDILAIGFCQTLAPLGPASATRPAGKSGLSYDPLTGWYIYVWKTNKSWDGTAWMLTIELIDGTQHVAYFMFQ